MAESCAPLPAGGFECEFVDAIPESLFCPVCLLPFRDPHLVSCCGAKYCEPCISRVKAAGQPCPLCKQQFVTLLDRSLQRKVLELKVRCSRKKDGCEWEGEVRHLSDHEKEECVWALVECGYHCGERLPRRQLAEHEQDVCPQRPVDVKLESFMRKMEERHMREMAVVREELEIVKQQMKEKHQTMEKKLDEQEKKFKDELTLSKMEALIATKLISQLSLIPPCEFTMTDYSRHKRDCERWYSPPFYTGPGGYKLCLGAYTLVGNMSVHMYLMRGEYDDRLVWPFRGDITIQLVNLIGDHNHHQAVFHFDDNILMTLSSRSRVTSGERAKNGCGIYFIQQIVESATSTCQYVKNNCLTFRVTSAVVVMDDRKV